MRPYRVLFALAAAYNFAFGVWAGLFPQSFFTLFRLEPINYPSLWACLGMVVGVYAIAYAYVAWKPEDGDVLIWIGLIGKILGPLGWVKTVWEGGLPPRTFALVLCNDLVWWFPFLLYLFRNNRNRSKILISLIAAVHVFACAGALLARRGTEIVGEIADRQRWVLASVPLWTSVWFAWVLSSLSLLALFPLWATALKDRFRVSGAVKISALIAVAVAFDLMGEWNYIVRATDPSLTLAAFGAVVSRYNLFSVVIANGLYCLLGLGFSLVSWQRSFLKGGVGVLGFLTWGTGLALSAAALFSWRQGIILGAAGVMAFFLPWLILAGWRFQQATSTEPL